MLGRTSLKTSKTSSPVLKSIKNTVQKDVNEVISDAAKALNIHDFYSAHVLDYCEVCSTLPCVALKGKFLADSTITKGLLHANACDKSNLNTLEEYYFLLQSDFFLLFRSGSRNPE